MYKIIIFPVEEEESAAELEARTKQDQLLSEQFVDIFLKTPDNISLILGLLEVSFFVFLA